MDHWKDDEYPNACSSKGGFTKASTANAGTRKWRWPQSAATVSGDGAPVGYRTDHRDRDCRFRRGRGARLGIVVGVAAPAAKPSFVGSSATAAVVAAIARPEAAVNNVAASGNAN